MPVSGETPSPVGPRNVGQSVPLPLGADGLDVRYEVVVADNGSEDGSQQIALDHGARRVRNVIHVAVAVLVAAHVSLVFWWLSWFSV